ncbi:hypothetical protein EDB81DRAFT_897108 [Dactylonectria macrodidyma]|uniref:Uncharacterized protein n=1 Tax=Dactylonectria macrodidyma TaxID=307937 RepID=A0A9P9FS32_9HYPO|nr:hypothetical protein EDB81DRAFT_897108 [Dactylonectria macrodidyma]
MNLFSGVQHEVVTGRKTKFESFNVNQKEGQPSRFYGRVVVDTATQPQGVAGGRVIVEFMNEAGASTDSKTTTGSSTYSGDITESIRDAFQLRVEAAEVVTALCTKRETAKRKHIEQRTQADALIKEESPEPAQFPLQMKKTQCPRCIDTEGM